MTPAKPIPIFKVFPTRKTLDAQSPDFRYALVDCDPDASQNGVWVRRDVSGWSTWVRPEVEEPAGRFMGAEGCFCVLLKSAACGVCEHPMARAVNAYEGTVMASPDPFAGQYRSRLSRMASAWLLGHLNAPAEAKTSLPFEDPSRPVFAPSCW